MYIGKILFWIIPSLVLAATIIGLAYSWRVDKGIAAALCVLLLVFIGYHYYDNNRIVVKREFVFLEGLPPAFEDFAILQITDLHGKNFGQNQVNLTSQINALEYDMIAFTGDMETSSKTFGPFVELLEGIKNRENMFYVNGNKDLAYRFLTGIKTSAGHKIEEYGCTLLDKPYPLMREGKTLWLVDDLSTTYPNFDPYQGAPRAHFSSDAEYLAYQKHFNELSIMAVQFKDSQDLTISLTHIPHTQAELEQTNSPVTIWDCDLILAGHYHGGQVRIPFYGAPFIPARAHFLQNFFPDQRYVKGLMPGNGLQQYISCGLGSNNVPFRLFNTPEINLLTLKAK